MDADNFQCIRCSTSFEFFIHNIIAHHFVRRLIERFMPVPNFAAEQQLELLAAPRHSQLQQPVHQFAEARLLAEELGQISISLRSEVVLMTVCDIPMAVEAR
jgi:hypothetical protein